MPVQSNYAINVFWSSEDESWIADVPDLPHCYAFGDSPEVAIREVTVTQRLWLETARDQGFAIPAPHYRPRPARRTATG